MSEQQTLSVSYGSFSCEIVGFQDPLPVLQDVIGEFRQIAWRYPGFGAQKDDAQRDRLSRLVASKLNAALIENGVAVALNQDTGGLLVHPVDGADKGGGWGDLYAKPKPGDAAKKSGLKHAAATVAETVTAPLLAETPVDFAEAAPETPAPEVAPTDEPAVVEAPIEFSAEVEIEEAPETAPPEVEVDEPTAEHVHVAAADEGRAPLAEVEAAPERPHAETTAETAAGTAAEEAEPHAETAVDDEPTIFLAATGAKDAPDALENEDLIAAHIREEVESVVNSEIKDAFAELHSTAEPDITPPAAADAADAEEPKSSLFSRILGAKKKFAPSAGSHGAQDAPATEPLHLTGREAVAAGDRPAERFAARSGEATLDAAFDAIAKQSGAAAKEAADNPDTDKDFVFAGNGIDKAHSNAALHLTSENAVDPDDAEDAQANDARVARAKAKVMERAKERQAAETAATERRLRIIRREQVVEKTDQMADAVADAASGAPAMSAADFIKLAGAASLQELMEASAAYATLVGGKHKFTRSDLMDVMSELDETRNYSPEARIKSFGKMLRTGVLLRVDDGLFAMSHDHRRPYETKIHA